MSAESVPRLLPGQIETTRPDANPRGRAITSFQACNLAYVDRRSGRPDRNPDTSLLGVTHAL